MLDAQVRFLFKTVEELVFSKCSVSWIDVHFIFIPTAGASKMDAGSAAGLQR